MWASCSQDSAAGRGWREHEGSRGRENQLLLTCHRCRPEHHQSQTTSEYVAEIQGPPCQCQPRRSIPTETLHLPPPGGPLLPQAQHCDALPPTRETTCQHVPRGKTYTVENSMEEKQQYSLPERASYVAICWKTCSLLNTQDNRRLG